MIKRPYSSAELSHLNTGPAIGETAFGHERAGRCRPGKNLFPKRSRIVCKYAISWNYIGRTASEAMMEARTKNTASVLDTKSATVLNTKEAATVLDTKEAATVLDTREAATFWSLRTSDHCAWNYCRYQWAWTWAEYRLWALVSAVVTTQARHTTTSEPCLKLHASLVSEKESCMFVLYST